ncbi:Oxidoreductase NAD-binding domain-containing protein [Streptomyces sp. ScaeMP-e83]|nr:Oxidoreductase NAD-binding domain-containing protein [Streptomyces sp. ScaeMP-e83]
MAMAGPGTGVAPFVGFLEERRALGHTGPNWLFLGEQRRAADFYYREELEVYRAAGHLGRLGLAFSRDQRNKVYVQDRMREHGPRLWQWLRDGAHFYVCGDASRMAEDVDQALRDIAAAHGGMDADEASAYVRRLASDRRYVRDVYRPPRGGFRTASGCERGHAFPRLTVNSSRSWRFSFKNSCFGPVSSPEQQDQHR